MLTHVDYRRRNIHNSVSSMSLWRITSVHIFYNSLIILVDLPNLYTRLVWKDCAKSEYYGNVGAYLVDAESSERPVEVTTAIIINKMKTWSWVIGDGRCNVFVCCGFLNWMGIWYYGSMRHVPRLVCSCFNRIFRSFVVVSSLGTKNGYSTTRRKPQNSPNKVLAAKNLY